MSNNKSESVRHRPFKNSLGLEKQINRRQSRQKGKLRALHRVLHYKAHPGMSLRDRPGVGGCSIAVPYALFVSYFFQSPPITSKLRLFDLAQRVTECNIVEERIGKLSSD